jgi:GDP-4-dehydro-6-deoxy-D-mannose reductase
MKRSALITGGTGFVGQWLIKALLERDVAVTSAAPLDHPVRWVLSDEERGAVSWVTADVRDGAGLGTAIDHASPDLVFHLAAVAFPPDATQAPLAAYEINLLGMVRLAHELLMRRGALDPVVLVVGSGEQYGRHPDSAIPLDETAALLPQTTYAATKVGQEAAALQCFLGEGLKVVLTRSFNHSGPGHAPHYLLPSLVSRAAELRRSGGNTLVIGNPDVVRDYTHVSDVVEAYCLLAEQGSPGEAYNVCSGQGVSVRELAETVLHRTGITAEISVDPTLSRRLDIPTLVGSPAKLQEATGWAPRRTREDIIDDLIRWTDAASD